MSTISSILPTRSNSNRVTASWFNAIRTALLTLFGDEAASETDFTIANNQVAAADVTGMVFSSSSSRTAVVRFDIRRKTDTASTERRSTGTLALAYRLQTAAWEILGQDEYGDFHGVTFTITAAGQVQYTSDSISGANYVGQLKFKSETYND
jgi:hypothetical protein